MCARIASSPARTAAARRPREKPPASPGPADPVESEWQFDAQGFDAVERWLRNLPRSGAVRVEAPTTTRLRDLYLDTRDWKVFRAAYALRIRQAKRVLEATLKSAAPRADGLVVRREITQPLSAATPAALFGAPGPVTERLRHFCTARELRSLAEVRTTRRRFGLRLRGAPAGEVTLDRSVVEGAPAPQGRLLRVEVEVPPYLVEELRPFVGELRAAGELTPAERSKREWALAALGLEPARPPKLGEDRVLPAMTVGEAAYAVLRRHFSAVLWHEPGTRLGEDPEHLHDMRVATRRMRAALRLFSDALPARDVERLRRELRALGLALGAVRDLDVRLEQVQAWRGSLITVEPAALDPFLDVLHARRRAARGQLMKILDSARYRRLTAFLRNWLRRGPATRRPGASVPLRAAGPEIVRRARKRLMRQGRALDDNAPPAAYHRARILGKRLRYALEFLEPAYGPPARALILPLVQVQDVLGLHQDAHVSMAALPALAREEGSRLPGATHSAVGEIAQLYAAQAARLRAQFPATFRRLRGDVWTTLLATMEQALSDLAAEVLAAHISRPATGRGAGTAGRRPAGTGRGVGNGHRHRAARHRRRARRQEVAR